MSKLIVFLYRSTWITLVGWFACLLIGLYIGYEIAQYQNGEEAERLFQINEEFKKYDKDANPEYKRYGPTIDDAGNVGPIIEIPLNALYHYKIN